MVNGVAATQPMMRTTIDAENIAKPTQAWSLRPA